MENFNCTTINDENNVDLLSAESNNTDLVAFVKMSKEKIYEASNNFGLDYTMVQNQSMGWWLRTPGENMRRYMRVNCNGAIRLYGREVNRFLVGLRPALRLRGIYE